MTGARKEGTTKAPRRTPAQLAADKLAGAQARLKAKADKRDRLQRELATTEKEITVLDREVAYLAQNPHLETDRTDTGLLDG